MEKIKYEFELNIYKDYAKHNDIDEWGCAFVWIDDLVGCEYNFCVQNGENCSAIYIMEYSNDDENWHTDWSNFNHYEIDFEDVDWAEKIEQEMYEFALGELEEYEKSEDSAYKVSLYNCHEPIQCYCFFKLEDAKKLKSAIEKSFNIGAYARISKYNWR